MFWLLTKPFIHTITLQDKKFNNELEVLIIVKGIMMQTRPLPQNETRKRDPQHREGHIIDLRQMQKDYEAPSGSFTALQDINLRIQTGEFVAVVGKSGSGKTTLLNLLAGIDRPTKGEAIIAETNLGSLTESGLAEWRGRNVGLVFQFFQLLPTLTVAENVMLPMDFAEIVPAAKRRSKALELLERVDIRDQADKLPVTLSGGQQQRAAIARALANDPPILMADEPTGNLDEATRTSVLELFAKLNAEGRTIIVVTHERDISRYTSRQVTLVDGRVADDIQK